MKKEITIISGHDTNEEREQLTLDWLRKHNVRIEDERGLLIITMRAEQPSEGPYTHQWTTGFDTAEGDQEQSYLVIDLEPNVYDTSVSVKFEGSYSCTCKGLACVKCNDELAALAAGRNPYLHHTLKVGDLVHYRGELATIAGQAYTDPADYRLVCLVNIQGESGPATVVAVTELEPGA